VAVRVRFPPQAPNENKGLDDALVSVTPLFFLSIDDLSRFLNPGVDLWYQ